MLLKIAYLKNYMENMKICKNSSLQENSTSKRLSDAPASTKTNTHKSSNSMQIKKFS